MSPPLEPPPTEKLARTTIDTRTPPGALRATDRRYAAGLARLAIEYVEGDALGRRGRG
jgi:hypothetical protein